MKKIFKCKNLFLVTFLAIAGFFSAGAFVINKQVNETPVVEKAEAAVDSRFSILIHSSSWWKDESAEMWATYSSAGQVQITPDSDMTITNGFNVIDIGGTDYYCVSIPVDKSVFTYGNFYFARKDPSTHTEWNNSGWILSPSKVEDGTCNTVRIDASSNFYQDWGNYWKITTYSGKTDYSSTTGATKNAYLKSAGYNFMPSDPAAPSGYTFDGWYTNKTFTNKWTSSSKPTADTTLYAKYNPITYTVSFNMHGHGSQVASQTVNYGSTATNPGNPTATGYTFGGWYTTNSYTVAYNFSTKIYSDTEIHAKWTINSYQITKYKVVDGGSPIQIDSESVEYNTNYPVPSSRYEDNCVFEGWYTNDACTVSYTARNITSNLDLYAKYTTHGPWSGTVNVDFRSSGWSDANANYALCLMNKTYSPEQTGWSTYLTGVASGEHFIQLSYSVGFEPIEMIVVRYDSSYSQTDWNTQKWPGDNKVWGQTLDITYAEMIRIGAETGSYTKKYNSTSGYPEVGRWSPPSGSVSLSSVKSNDSHHTEYYSTTVEFSKNQEFKVILDDVYYDTFSTHESLYPGYFDGGSGSNIRCLIAGTYAIYFDSVNNSIYITTEAIAEADEWSIFFLANVNCDATGRTEPSGWSTCATEYGKLSDGAKDIVYQATGDPSPTAPVVKQAVARYDAAIRSHPGLTHFIVNSSSTPRAAVSNISSFSPYSLISDENGVDGSTIIIIVASSISLLSITALSVLLVKKRKAKQD